MNPNTKKLQCLYLLAICNGVGNENLSNQHKQIWKCKVHLGTSLAGQTAIAPSHWFSARVIWAWINKIFHFLMTPKKKSKISTNNNRSICEKRKYSQYTTTTKKKQIFIFASSQFFPNINSIYYIICFSTCTSTTN